MIGEAVGRLSVDLRERHPDVPWRQIIAVRHRIVHAYFDLDWQILRDASIDDIPSLRRQVLNILNVFVSALIAPADNEAMVVLAIKQGWVKPYYSAEMLEEYAGVLARRKFRTGGRER